LLCSSWDNSADPNAWLQAKYTLGLRNVEHDRPALEFDASDTLMLLGFCDTYTRPARAKEFRET
jgi:hypothetical protein